MGDLPPDFTDEEVAHLFAPLGALKEVRVMGSQCYAFVTFQSENDATEVIRRFATHPMTAGGHRLRINRAYGQLPDWKVRQTHGLVCIQVARHGACPSTHVSWISKVSQMGGHWGSAYSVYSVTDVL